MRVYILQTENGVDGYLSAEECEAQYDQEIEGVLQNEEFWEDRFETDKAAMNEKYDWYLEESLQPTVIEWFPVDIETKSSEKFSSQSEHIAALQEALETLARRDFMQAYQAVDLRQVAMRSAEWLDDPQSWENDRGAAIKALGRAGYSDEEIRSIRKEEEDEIDMNANPDDYEDEE